MDPILNQSLRKRGQARGWEQDKVITLKEGVAVSGCGIVLMLIGVLTALTPLEY